MIINSKQVFYERCTPEKLKDTKKAEIAATLLIHGIGSDTIEMFKVHKLTKKLLEEKFLIFLLYSSHLIM